MMGAIGRCHSCELPIIEGESYHIYGGKTSHSNNQCVARLKQRVAELEKDAARYRFLRDNSEREGRTPLFDVMVLEPGPSAHSISGQSLDAFVDRLQIADSATVGGEL